MQRLADGITWAVFRLCGLRTIKGWPVDMHGG